MVRFRVTVRFRAWSCTGSCTVPSAVGDGVLFPGLPSAPPSSSTRIDKKCRRAPPISGSRANSTCSSLSDDGASMVTPVDSSFDASGAPRWSSAPHMSTPPLGNMAQSDPHVRNVAATVPSVPDTNLSNGLTPRPSKPSSCPKMAVSLISPLSSEGTVLGMPSMGPAMSTYAATCLSVQLLPPPPPPSLNGASTQFRKYLTSWSPYECANSATGILCR